MNKKLTFFGLPWFRACDVGSLCDGSLREKLLVLTRLQPFKKHANLKENVALEQAVKRVVAEQVAIAAPAEPQVKQPVSKIVFDDTELTKIVSKSVDAEPQEIRQAVAMARGFEMETLVLDEYNELHGTNFTKDDKLLMWSLPTFKICGRIDGRDGDTIIEIKTTNNRDVPHDKHLVQVESYLHMSGAKKCILLYKFGDGTTREFVRESDPELRQQIEDACTKFMTEFNGMTRKDFVAKLTRYNLI